MDPVPADVSNPPPVKVPSATHPANEDDVASGQDNSAREAPTTLSPTGISSWAKNLKVSPSFSGSQDTSLLVEMLGNQPLHASQVIWDCGCLQSLLWMTVPVNQQHNLICLELSQRAWLTLQRMR